MLVSGIEVTERRRLEVEKERERAFLNAIANNAPSMLCLIDADGRLTQGGANIAFEHTLGYAPTEIGGQVLWEDFVDPAEADEVRALVEAVAGGRAAEGARQHLGHAATAAGCPSPGPARRCPRSTSAACS